MKRASVLVLFLALAYGGTGSAGTPPLVPAGSSPFAVGDPSGQVLLADVDRDGRLDLLTRHQQARAIKLHLGDGRTGSGRRTHRSRSASHPATWLLAFGDVDGDRDIDAVTAVSHPESGRLDVYLNDGRRFRWKPDARLRLPATYELEALGDMNSDRRPDLVFSHRDAHVGVLLNRGGGRYARAAGSPFTLEARPFSVVPADLDGDDQVDLVVATEDSVTALLGERGAFPRARQSTFHAGPGAFDVAVGDVSGDGRPDVVASSFESGAVTVLLGR
jgi:FG-GAP-like repeat